MRGVEKIFHVTNVEFELIEGVRCRACLSALVPFVWRVEFVERSGPWASPLRLLLPVELCGEIERVVGERCVKATGKFRWVLVEAARVYRSRVPVPVVWSPPDWNEFERLRRESEPAALDRRTVVLRLSEDERLLLKDLGRADVPMSRHGALCELVSIVRGMASGSAPDVFRVRGCGERRAVRVVVPVCLDRAIRVRACGRKRKYYGTLVEAARLYRDSGGVYYSEG